MPGSPAGGCRWGRAPVFRHGENPMLQPVLGDIAVDERVAGDKAEFPKEDQAHGEGGSGGGEEEAEMMARERGTPPL